MTGRSKRILSWVCLTLQLVGAGLAFGRMLCIASDGHIALEVAHSGSCGTEDRRHEHDATETGIGCAEHPCTDVALADAAGLPRPPDDGAPAHVAVIALRPSAAARAGDLVVASVASPAPPPDALARRRTVVLLV